MNSLGRTIWFLIIAAALVAVGAWLRDSGNIPSFSQPTTSPSDLATPQVEAKQTKLKAQGWLEAIEGAVTVSGVGADPLVSISVKEGDQVQESQELGRFRSYELREIEVRSLRQQLEEAHAKLESEVKVGEARKLAAEVALKKAQAAQEQVESQKDQIDLIEATLELEKSDLDRLKSLKEKSSELVSLQRLERQTLLVRKYGAELAAANSNYHNSKTTASLAVEAADADLRAADAALAQVVTAPPIAALQAQLDLATKQRDLLVVRSPRNGVVTKVFAKAGELVTGRPIVQIADLSRYACVAEIYETDLGKIRVGQDAKIWSKAFDGAASDQAWNGKVVQIGKVVMSPELRSIDPQARGDRHVVNVRIELEPLTTGDPGSGTPFALLNMQVDVEIDIR